MRIDQFNLPSKQNDNFDFNAPFKGLDLLEYFISIDLLSYANVDDVGRVPAMSVDMALSLGGVGESHIKRTACSSFLLV